MSDTADIGSPNLPEYTVTELSSSLKRTIEDAYGYVRVRGELSGFMAARSGHLYFSLKDDKSVIDGVCWRGNAGKLRFKPEDGLEVICTGKLSTYAPRSRYQIIVDSMEPAGIGALMALLDERRKKLTAEGLFEQERKQPLPYLPDVIGVVTSPTGAVIRDILHRLRDRFPSRVLLWPVLVQGDAAAVQIAAAIHGFNRLGDGTAIPRPDLIIVARGGGSIEDLWAFNEEVVVRAAAESRIPLISAVGHETDTTLIDFASDRRAPTPTAAAEVAVPVRSELMAQVADLDRRQRLAVARHLSSRRQLIDGLARGLRGPRDLLALAQQRLDDASSRLERALVTRRNEARQRFTHTASRLQPHLVKRSVETGRQRLGDTFARLVRAETVLIRDTRGRLQQSAKLLQSLSFERVLERGYAVVRGADGTLVTAATETTPGQRVNIGFRDGDVGAVIDGDRQAGSGAGRPRRKPAGSDDQGSLF
jgi:exodeoxyribonuclease VII large subunit